MAAVKAFLLGLVAVIELATVSWCALWPLRGDLADLARASGWWQLVSFALGNLDVMLLAAAKELSLVLLVVSTPARKTTASASASASRERERERDGSPLGASNHSAVRKAISALCGLHAAFLLVKAAAVAVTAPEQLWPGPPESGDGGGGHRMNVGLVFLYVSIVVSLLSSLISQLLAKALVSEREDAWEAVSEPTDPEANAADPLRAPLLGQQAAAAAASAPAARGAQAGKAAAGGGGGDGGGGGAGGGAAGDAAGRAAAAKRKQRTLLELLRLSFVDWPLLLVAFSAGSLAALGSASIAYLTGQMIDYASIELDRSRFTHTTLRLLLVAGLTALFTGARGGLFTVANTRLNVRLRKSLFHALLQMEVGFFDTNRTGEIISRLSADTSTVSDQVGLNLNVMLRSATQAAMVLFFMFAASWRLTVVTFILVPVVLTISQVYGKYYSKMSKKVQAELANANVVADEVLSTMTTVKAHAVQDSAEAAYAAKLRDFYKLQVLEAGAYSLYAILNTFLPNVVTAVVLFYGGNLVLEGVMSRGALVSFMLYQQSLSSAFQLMGDVFSALTAAVGAADKVIELMKRQPSIPPSGGLVLPSLKGRVEARALVFHYPARPEVRVLNGLSLVAQPGGCTGGSLGGGKSSIIKLLERFYVPASGRILIDGRDLDLFDHKWLRRQVALVSQEPVLYARSIRRNIILGLEPEDGCAAAPSQEDVEEAAKQANAHDFISSFPGGYETDCGEKGVALSGGQKQRVAVARALVRRPRVLLLDEATSALDADSEAVVQEALDRVMYGRTVIVIAHRLSTIQGADRIYVIGKGVVQETGTHDDLLASGGVYSQLVRRQLTRPMSQASMCGTEPGASPSQQPLATEPAPPPPPPASGNASGSAGGARNNFLLQTNLLSLARRQLANFLAASSSDLRPSVSATLLTSLLPDNDNNGNNGNNGSAQASPQPAPPPPPPQQPEAPAHTQTQQTQQQQQSQPQGGADRDRAGGAGTATGSGKGTGTSRRG